MTSPILSIQAPLQSNAVQSTVVPSLATSAIPLILGESLAARVLTNNQHNILLQIKNATVTATGNLPLHIGERLVLRVDQLHPAVVLRIISRDARNAIDTGEFLKLHRSNPGALKDMIVALQDILKGEHPNDATGGTLQRLRKIMDHIVISKTNVTNPLFVKGYITALGLTLERRLMNALTNPASLEDEENQHTLKETLLNLASETQTIRETPESTESDPSRKPWQPSGFVDQALKVIESLQVVNVLAQEQENLFLIQIPFQCSDGIRMQDIFIETDRNKNGRDGERICRVVLFLDMDALGELGVDAALKDRTFRCTIKCQTQDVLHFISSLLPELREKLSGIGYEVCSLECVRGDDIRSCKHEFLAEYRLFSQNIVDTCV
jgi:hypothetical protein